MGIQSFIRSNRFLFIISLLYIILWTFIAISPHSRSDWFLENILVVLFVAFLVVTYKKFRFSDTSYFFMILFLALHTIGSGYSYMVPWYDDFFQSRAFKFDRMVHFSSGALLCYPTMEFLHVKLKVAKNWAKFISVLMILAIGAFYELIEMWVANIVRPELGKLFLGDADGWDAHHDMEVALLGAIVAMCVVSVKDFFVRKNQMKGNRKAI